MKSLHLLEIRRQNTLETCKKIIRRQNIVKTRNKILRRENLIKMKCSQPNCSQWWMTIECQPANPAKNHFEYLTIKLQLTFLAPYKQIFSSFCPEILWEHIFTKTEYCDLRKRLGERNKNRRRGRSAKHCPHLPLLADLHKLPPAFSSFSKTDQIIYPHFMYRCRELTKLSLISFLWNLIAFKSNCFL